MVRDGLLQAANSFRIAFNGPEENIWAIVVDRSCVYKALQCLNRRTQDTIVVLAGTSESVYIVDLIRTSQVSKTSESSELTAEYNTP